MALTKKQLKEIQDIIRRRFLVFTYETLGDEVLSDAEIEELKRLGVIRANVRNMVGDSYALGKVLALVHERRGEKLTYKKLVEMAKRGKPMTDVEKKAIEYAKQHAGVYIQGIRDDMLKDTSALASRAGQSALRAIQEGVAEAVAERQTRSELKTALFDAINDRHRDWLRVAHTEINTTIQNAIRQEIQDKSSAGSDQRVYKRPAPNACKHCKRLYLKDDGMTPRIFKLSHLEDTNIGRKAHQWRPVVGSVHPWCNCQLMVVPDGFDFVKKWVVKHPFEFEGRAYKAGQTLTQAEISALDDDLKSKIGEDVVLEFTGTTGRPIRKSELRKALVSCDDPDCNHQGSKA